MIQKHFRGMASRKYWVQLRRSTIKLQNGIYHTYSTSKILLNTSALVIRKVQAKKLLAGLRRNHAALRIQTCFRCYRKRKMYKNTRRLATRLQLSMHAPPYITSHILFLFSSFPHLVSSHPNSFIAIQAWQAKRQLSVYKHEAASIALQTYIRGYAARGKLYRRRRCIALLQVSRGVRQKGS